MVLLGWDRHPRIPSKLAIAEEDAATKPPEVTSTVVKSAFAAISSRFPSEISLEDLQIFVRTHGLGIPQSTVHEMVRKATAKRQNWRAKGRDLPLRVMRDRLWVEDVMWALRVRKTRRKFDKWEVNEHRNEWVSILEAATPDDPTVFATAPDHRVAPPLSYTELLQCSMQVPVGSSSNGSNVSAGRCGGSSGSGRRIWKRGGESSAWGSTESVPSCVTNDNWNQGGRGRGGETIRPASTGKMWTPLESRLPQSLLLTSRPGSGAGAAAPGAGTTTVGAEDSAWKGEGGVGDSTVLCFPNWAGAGSGSGGGGGNKSHYDRHDREGRGGGSHPAVVTAQDRALFGRKPSPATVARSTSYAPRRRPTCSSDGRRSKPETESGDDTVELHEMERDINNSSFTVSATGFRPAPTLRRRGPTDGRCATRAGSVVSAFTSDDDYVAEVGRASTAPAAVAAEASTVGEEEARAAFEEAVRPGGDHGEGRDGGATDGRGLREGRHLDNVLQTSHGEGVEEGADSSASRATNKPEHDQHGGALISVGANGAPSRAAGIPAPTHGGESVRIASPRPTIFCPFSSSPSPGSSGGRESATVRPASVAGAATTPTAATASTPVALGPAIPARQGRPSPALAIVSGGGGGVNAGGVGRGGLGSGGDGIDERGGVAARSVSNGEHHHGVARAQCHGPRCEKLGGQEAEGAAEWWLEARGPKSIRPVTRRSPVGGRGSFVCGTRLAGCAWEQQQEDKHRHGSRQMMAHSGSDGSGGGFGNERCAESRTAVPICGFSAESRQRSLCDFLKRRSSIDEIEGFASARVRELEAVRARARTGERFRHIIGRDTIRKNFDQSLRDKAHETLALDLRGYGTRLIAPETIGAPDRASGHRDHDCDSSHPLRTSPGGGATTTPKPRTTNALSGSAWSSGRAEGKDDVGGGCHHGLGGGGGDGGGGGGGGDSRKPSPFWAVRGVTLQEARIAVAADHAGLWGKCAQGHFGRYEEKPYFHSFRPHTSHGLRGFGR